MNPGEKLPISKGNHFQRHLEYASAILTRYNGAEPFHLYIKKYFSANKKHGSKDRRQITSLCYKYFRLGFGVTALLTTDEKIALAIFLVEKNPSQLPAFLRQHWNEKAHPGISEKLGMVKNIFDPEKIFPFQGELSDQINFQQFSLSFLVQPKLFIRIRPGYDEAVIKKLKSVNISFEKIDGHCLAFTNNEKVSTIIDIDKEAVIQDYNSQRVGNFLKLLTVKESPSAVKVWDCCAASGGKSILAHDILKNVELTVSDSRKSILENLRTRFAKAGIKNYHSFVADLSMLPSPEEAGGRAPFDLIIADVPCTGSGTWARTPEQLSFFSKKSIENYVFLQRKIIGNAGSFLKAGGYFLYITCSVFKKENEENVSFIQKKLALELIEFYYLKGYEMQSDTLFAALFKK